jgi:hypothetical protein
MNTYLVTLDDGSTFLMKADMVQAAASISANFHGEEDDWQGTPFQTANARHSAGTAAELVNDYFRGHGDDSAVMSVERVK